VLDQMLAIVKLNLTQDQMPELTLDQMNVNLN
jgi:hypothetical protein